jgi:alkaline phosphatase
MLLNSSSVVVPRFLMGPSKLALQLSLCALMACSNALAGDSKTQDPAPKNIILMIADGAGYQAFKAASLYAHGTSVAPTYEKFGVKLAMATYSGEEGDQYDPIQAQSDATYVKRKPVDSAASATALATGHKTYNTAIGMALDSTRLVNLTQVAQKLGKSAGVVTTVQFAHATPASMVAHNLSRKNYSQIATEMLQNSTVEVIIGAGHPEYNNNAQKAPNWDADKDGKAEGADYQYVGSEALWKSAQAGTLKNAEGPWRLVQDSVGFAQIAQKPSLAPSRLLGVLPVYETAQYDRTGSDSLVYQQPRNPGVPELHTTSRAALNVLHQNPKGFFLMIEGGAVDWAGHDNRLNRSIEEKLDFNKAVDSVVAWVQKNSSWKETLLIVTADHETGYLSGPGGLDTVAKRIDTTLVPQGKGKIPLHTWNSGKHTNQLVPLFARGAGADSLRNLASTQKDPHRGPYLHSSEVGAYLIRTLGR